jgi:hypothetical protein
MGGRDAGVLARFGQQVQTILYDFDRDGGSIGEINLGGQLPAGSYVTAVYADAQTAPDSAGEGSSLKLIAGSTDLTAAETESEFDNGANSMTLADSDGIKLTASSDLKVDISGEDLTSGKIRFAVYFHHSE